MVFNKYRWYSGSMDPEENIAVLVYYAVRSDNSLPTFRDNLRGPIIVWDS